MHAIEKLLAKKSGKASVKTGEIINCEIDMAGINDLYLQTIRSFYEMGGTKVYDPSKVIMFLDHYEPTAQRSTPILSNFLNIRKMNSK